MDEINTGRCDTCKHGSLQWYEAPCFECLTYGFGYEPKEEEQVSSDG